LKRTAQDSAQAAYKMRDRGATKQLGADDLLDEATARGLRKGIENRAPVADVNKVTQSRIGVDRMVSDSVGREGNNLAIGGAKEGLAVLGGIGGYLGTGDTDSAVKLGLLTRLLATPSTGSMVAIGANEVGRSQLIQNALRALMASHEPAQ
jgi:hypothetical protein